MDAGLIEAVRSHIGPGTRLPSVASPVQNRNVSPTGTSIIIETNTSHTERVTLFANSQTRNSYSAICTLSLDIPPKPFSIDQDKAPILVSDDEEDEDEEERDTPVRPPSTMEITMSSSSSSSSASSVTKRKNPNMEGNPPQTAKKTMRAHNTSSQKEVCKPFFYFQMVVLFIMLSCLLE
jgi:hypothetical protein